MIATHASHLAAAGHNVTIKTNLVNSVFNIDPRVRIERLGFAGKLGTLFSAVLDRHDADIVLADIIPIACLLALRNRRETVYFAQDYDESYYTSSFLKLFVRCCYFLGLKMFRIPVISVSRPLSEILKKRFNAEVEVVENGVDTRVFYPDPDSELIEAKGMRKALLVLSRGDRRKGFDLAQSVIERLADNHKELFEVWTVGERCVGIFQNVIHRDFGYIGEEKLRRMMSSADLFFYPSRHEGLPLMPLEALACGCPVVTTTAVPYGSNEPSIQVTEVGDVEAMLRILITFLENDGLLNEFKQKGKGIVNKYDKAVCERRFEHSLANLLQG